MRWEIAYSSALVLGILSTHEVTHVQAFMDPSVVARQHAKQTTATSTRTTTPLFTSNLGWDNDNWLEALGGNNDQREDANEKYYKQSRFGRENWRNDEDEDDDSAQPPAPAPGMQPDMNQPSAPAMGPVADADLSVEEQARLFREMKLKQKLDGPNPSSNDDVDYAPFEGQNNAPQAKKPFGNAVASNGRRTGRNRDADAVVNTADVYFAQLKRDSNARNSARYRGDDDTANSVFKDPSIQDIKMHVNPHLEEIRKKEQEMIEVAADEMLELAAPDNRPIMPKGYSGVSYKDKIQQFKKNKGEAVAAPPVAKPVQAVVEAPPAPVAAPAPPVVEEQPFYAAQAVEAPPKAPEPVVQKAPVATAATPPAAPVAAQEAPPVVDVSMREGIRTLQGMLLKHRGGSGFGAGRLTGAEVNNFDQLATDVSAILRDEARHAPPVEEPAAVAQMAAVQAAQQTAAAVPTAVNTQPAGDRISGMIACMEGAIQMYKHSPPEMQEGVLVTLRAALLSAVNTCNDIIANNEVANVQAYQTATTSTSAPAQYYDAQEVEQEEEVGSWAAAAAAAAPTSSNTGTDNNSQVLQQVYNKLKAAAGDGKMGLRKGLDPQDASELADGIAEMRSLLVGELDGGIPEPEGQTGGAASATPTTSKYQELLAKARAEKEAKNSN